jgi:hypothetical protein
MRNSSIVVAPTSVGSSDMRRRRLPTAPAPCARVNPEVGVAEHALQELEALEDVHLEGQPTTAA